MSAAGLIFDPLGLHSCTLGGIQVRPLSLLERVLQRHDVLSTGMGSLLVTSYCVWRGQSPAMALGITVLATISGLVSRLCFKALWQLCFVII